MYVSCCTDILYNTTNTTVDCLNQICELKKYTNECLKNVENTYKCKVIKIDVN